MKPDVVLGGGVAGLAAALKLCQESSRPVVLLEQAKHLGGLAATLDWEGCRIDLGPHRIYTLLPEIEKFIHDLLGDELLKVHRKSSMFLKSNWLDYPVRFGEILSALGPTAALRIPLSYLGSLASFWKYPETSKQSYREYISSRFGNYLYQLLFHEYAIKVWQEDPQNLSAQMAITRLASPNLISSALEILSPSGKNAVTEFHYPRGGIGRMSEQMGEEITKAGGKILCNTKVSNIIMENLQIKSITADTSDGSFEIEPERVISTLPLPILFKALEPIPPEAIFSASTNLPFACTLLTYVLFDQPQVRPDCWLYFPDPEIPFTRTYEVNNFDRGNVPQGQSCLCVETPCREGDSQWKLSDDDLQGRILGTLKKIGLGDSEKILKLLTIRLKNVYPIYTKGYESALTEVASYLSTLRNLVSTGRGGFFTYNNTDHSIDMGLLAAEFFLKEHSEKGGTEGFYRHRPRFEQYRIVD